MLVAVFGCRLSSCPHILAFIAWLGLPSWPIARVMPACRHERNRMGLEETGEPFLCTTTLPYWTDVLNNYVWYLSQQIMQ